MVPPRRRRTRGRIGTLPSSSFRAVVYAGADPLTDTPRYVRETHMTHAAAEKALTRLQGQVDEDRHPEASSRAAPGVAATSAPAPKPAP